MTLTLTLTLPLTLPRYEDYYDYKVTQAEGFGKAALFQILDTLEQGTRPLMVAAREQLAADKGASALEPWNTGVLIVTLGGPDP